MRLLLYNQSISGLGQAGRHSQLGHRLAHPHERRNFGSAKTGRRISFRRARNGLKIRARRDRARPGPDSQSPDRHVQHHLRLRLAPPLLARRKCVRKGGR